MTYTANIPVSGQSLGVTLSPINQNFTVLNNTQSVNHVAMNTIGAGKHFFVQMPVVASNTTLANEGGIFCKTINARTEAVFQRDGVLTDIQMTGNASTAQGGLGRGGTTTIFGGFQLKWAVVNTGGVYSWATETGTAFGATPVVSGILFSLSSTSYSLINVTSTNFTIAGIVIAPVQIIAIGV